MFLNGCFSKIHPKKVMNKHNKNGTRSMHTAVCSFPSIQNVEICKQFDTFKTCSKFAFSSKSFESLHTVVFLPFILKNSSTFTTCISGSTGSCAYFGIQKVFFFLECYKICLSLSFYSSLFFALGSWV